MNFYFHRHLFDCSLAVLAREDFSPLQAHPHNVLFTCTQGIFGVHLFEAGSLPLQLAEIQKGVAGLFSGRDARTKRLRELIVDLAPPAAKPADVQNAAAESAVQQSGLNTEQQDAVSGYDLSVQSQLSLQTLLLLQNGTVVSSIRQATSSCCVCAYTHCQSI